MQKKGSHIFLDYQKIFMNYEELNIITDKLFNFFHSLIRDNSTMTIVHSYLHIFDKNISPAGFTCVLLLDESHMTAHCYSDLGLLAIDLFTCGDTDTENLGNIIKEFISNEFSDSLLNQYSKIDRFIYN